MIELILVVLILILVFVTGVTVGAIVFARRLKKTLTSEEFVQTFTQIAEKAIREKRAEEELEFTDVPGLVDYSKKDVQLTMDIYRRDQND